MSRAAVPGLPSRHPIGEQLPALYADDDFAQRFTAGLDTVLAPVFLTLDTLPAYLDPRVAPADFLTWLGSWVGATDDPHWPEEQRREAVTRAMELHRWRGTVRGLTEALRLALGVRAEVTGAGAAIWSATPDTDLPPESGAGPVVRVWPAEGAADGPGVDPARVREIVRVMCPVHTDCRVEILSGPPTDEGR
ncbi:MULTISPECIES: phage tail protein [Streptomyces]|uniref:Phage tail protein n=2 Tax=Streptomyces TaxID=1883 RepID=A0ABW6YR34_9ACTN|nr:MULTISPECIES: phage tail protein [Streptomyces]MCL3993084.1 phage tail protein [Streptomyces lavenduligriseus]QIS72189.1 phage tail protein [Streptomyces sp. DSM 40868]WDM11199.1 phage tail protein [Streptomyces lavenduligriseus]